MSAKFPRGGGGGGGGGRTFFSSKSITLPCADSESFVRLLINFFFWGGWGGGGGWGVGNYRPASERLLK